MAYTGIWQDNLPWSDNENDRKTVGFIFISLFVCTILYTIVQFLPLMDVEQKKLEEVSPRLAKLIIERQKKPPPPPPIPQPKKKETPKPEPKKAEKPKPKPKPEPKKAKQPKPTRSEVARKQAQKHITEIQDALADLREFDVASLQRNKPVQSKGTTARNSDNTTAVIAARANKGSGGINTNRLSRATGDSHLQGRRTTAVTSAIDSGGRARGSRSGGSGAPSRPYEEIELVFQKNKGSIFSLYSRALRRDPTLQGKVVLELTIAPSGRVTNVRIVSSEIKDSVLLQKLKNRVKLFRFKAKNVDTLIVKYPIDFLPT
jgi:protein TonB